MSKTTEVLRVIVFQSGDAWVAQGLEVDICAQATDLNTLRSRLMAAVRAELDFGDPWTRIGPSPTRFHDLLAKRSDFSKSYDDGKGIPVELAVAA